MVFSGTVFLFWFLPTVVAAYYLCPRRGRNAVLLLFSLFFYSWGEPKYILIMLFSTVFDYCNGLGIAHFRRTGKTVSARLVLILSIIGNLGILGWFKYAGFAAGTVNRLLSLGIPVPRHALPIGISFYTFQTMSYTIDVYRGEVEPQGNPVDFAAYVTLFPQLIAGPIVRYQTVAADLRERRESLADASRGLQRFVAGLGKKVLLANQAGAVWEQISAMDHPAAATAWLGAIFFTFQIYFDFSGYSDMAIGLGRVFGFSFPENFSHPYQSHSVTEFWRRWHISLGTWFREYVYIPLGGSRRGRARQVLNLAAVWFLTGLWHGASWNFVLWGAYYAVLLILEKTIVLPLLEKVPAPAAHLYTCLCFTLGWVLFAIPDFSRLGAYLAALFTGPAADGTTFFYLRSNAILLLLSAAGCTSFPLRAWEGLCRRIPERGETALRTVGTVGLLLWSIAFLVGDSYNPFLYFRF